jgi:hypothetical protein
MKGPTCTAGDPKIARLRWLRPGAKVRHNRARPGGEEFWRDSEGSRSHATASEQKRKWKKKASAIAHMKNISFQIYTYKSLIAWSL